MAWPRTFTNERRAGPWHRRLSTGPSALFGTNERILREALLRTPGSVLTFCPIASYSHSSSEPVQIPATLPNSAVAATRAAASGLQGCRACAAPPSPTEDALALSRWDPWVTRVTLGDDDPTLVSFWRFWSLSGWTAHCHQA